MGEQNENELKQILETRFLCVCHIPLLCFAEFIDDQFDPALKSHEKITRILFTSKNAFSFWFDKVKRSGADPVKLVIGKKIAAVGRKTAERIQAKKIHVDLIPESQDTENLANALLTDLIPDEILWLPQSNIAGLELFNRLQPHCRKIFRTAVYQTKWIEENFSRLKQEATEDFLPVFTSPSGYQAFKRAGIQLQKNQTVACLGNTTAKFLNSEGIIPQIQPTDQSYRGLAEAIIKFFENPEY